MIFSHCAIRFEIQAFRCTGIFVTDILKKSMRTDWRIGWRNLFVEYTDEELPGFCLSGSRLKEGMTQKNFLN